MSRRRVVVVAALAVGLIAGGIWLATRGGDERAGAGGGSAASARGGAVQARGRQLHMAQPGAPGRRVAGRVTFDGQPVANATVTLAGGWSEAGVASATATTGADGRFDFGPQDAARIAIGAAAPGKTGAVQRLDLRDPTLRPAPDALELQLRPCAASVFGAVVDAGGGAIPGATVHRGPIAAVAAADGAYELCVPIGDVALTVGADGYGTIATRLAVHGRLHRDFRLSPEAVVAGRVVRDDDGSPVPGAVVRLDASDGPMSGMLAASGGAPAQTTTDASGQFRLTGVVPGRRQLSARADGLRTSSPLDVVAEVGDSGEEVVLALVAAVAVRGVVVDEARKPVPGATVTIAESGQRWEERTEGRDARSQADGTFVVDGIVPGDYALRVDPYQLTGTDRERPLTVPADGLTNLEVIVTRGSSVSGVVTRGGKPAAWADVSLRGGVYRHASTETDGRFTLRGVLPGQYTIYAQSLEEGAFTNGPAITVSAGSDVTGVAIELDLAGAISGTVVDQNGAPVPGVFLRFRLLEGRDYGEATTADDGTFLVRALSGGGTYGVAITASRRSSQRFAPASGDDFPAVAVADGSAHVRGVRYAVRLDRLTIGGKVVDERGQPVPDVRVEARRAAGDRTWDMGEIPSDVTDADGAFTIGNLFAGRYKVDAQAANGGEASAADIEAGARGVRMILAAPGEIEGTLAGFTGAPRIVARPMAMAPAATMLRELGAAVRGNTFRVRGLAPGRYRVSAIIRGIVGDHTDVEVVSRGTARVTLTYRGTGTISGVVTDAATGAPAAGARCTVFDLSHTGKEVRADGQGRFTIAPASVGDVHVGCAADGFRAHGSASVTVAANAQATVAVTIADAKRPRPRSTIGATFATTTDGPRVATVVDGGPAARAGVRAGDVVTGIEGFDLPFDYVDAETMDELVSSRRPGEVIKLKLKRGSETLTIAVTLAAR